MHHQVYLLTSTVTYLIEWSKKLGLKYSRESRVGLSHLDLFVAAPHTLHG